jgi:hypothetical protein
MTYPTRNKRVRPSTERKIVNQSVSQKALVAFQM